MGQQKYKVWVLAAGETTYATNAMEYDTPEDGEAAAINLFNRWFAAKRWAVLPVSEEFTGYLTAAVIETNALSTGC